MDTPYRALSFAPQCSACGSTPHASPPVVWALVPADAFAPRSPPSTGGGLNGLRVIALLLAAALAFDAGVRLARPSVIVRRPEHPGVAAPPRSEPLHSQRSFKPPPPSAPPDAIVPASLFADVAPGEHDPRHLLAVARRLAAAGTDIDIATMRLSRAARTRAVARDLGVLDIDFVRTLNGDRALRLVRIAPNSPIASFGLRDGDVLLSMNGWPIPASEHDGTSVPAVDRLPGMLVGELIRAGHRLLVAVSWQTDEPGHDGRAVGGLHTTAGHAPQASGPNHATGSSANRTLDAPAELRTGVRPSRHSRGAPALQRRG